MLDLHCHILPAVDDGPRTLAEALELAFFSERDGITHVVATPHCHQQFRTLRAAVVPRVERFNEDLRRAGLKLVVLPGSEIQVSDTAAYRADYEAGLFCHLGDDPAYTLLEFPWHERMYPPDAAAHVRWLKQRGTQPIVAHPERHDYFRHDPERLRGLADAGAWFQLTVDSMLDNHGPHARRAMSEILKTYPDVVLSTDAHGRDRCSGLSVGYRLVRDEFGPGRADDLRRRSDVILAHLLSGRQPRAQAV